MQRKVAAKIATLAHGGDRKSDQAANLPLDSVHGLQLSQEDKRNMTRRIYHITPERERDEK